MKKKIPLFLLSLFLSFQFVSPVLPVLGTEPPHALADNVANMTHDNEETLGNATTNPQNNTSSSSSAPANGGADSGVQDDQDGLFAKILAAFFNGINSALKALGFKDVNQLIFNQDKKQDNLKFGIFSDSQMTGQKIPIEGLHQLFMILSWAIIALQLILLGAKMARPVMDPAQRVRLGDLLIDLFVAGLLTTLSWVPFEFFGNLNTTFVNALNSSFPNGDFMQAVAQQSHSGFIYAITNTVYIIAGIYLNVLYFIRAYTIAILYAIGPIIAVLWLTPSKRKTFWMWISEIATNFLTQSIHALLLALFLSVYGSANDPFHVWWVPIVSLYALVPLSGVVRNLLTSVIGPSDTMPGTLATMTGMGALSGMAALGFQMAGKGVTGLRNAAGQWLNRRIGGQGNAGGMGGGVGGGPNGGPSSPLAGVSAPLLTPTGGGAVNSNLGSLASGVAQRSEIPESTVLNPPDMSALGKDTQARMDLGNGGVGKYSPNVTESIPALAGAIHSSHRYRAAAGMVGKAVGGFLGGMAGMASHAIPGGKGASIQGMAQAGARIGDAAVGTIGGLVGGVTGMARSMYNHHRQLGDQARSMGQPSPSLRESMRSALGLQGATGLQTAVRIGQMAGGIVGSLGGRSGSHLGMAAGHNTVRAFHYMYSRIPGGLERAVSKPADSSSQSRIRNRDLR